MSYIEREEMLDVLDEYEVPGEGLDEHTRFVMVEDLRAIPAADVAPVVYCRDCANCRHEDEYEYWCTGHGTPFHLVAQDDYCSRGRKEEHP